MGTVSVHLKLSSEDKEKVYACAKSRGMSANEFIRTAALKECKLCKPYESDDLRDLKEPVEGGRVHISIELDREALNKLDEERMKLGISRATLLKRMVMKKTVINAKICLNMDVLYKELIDLLLETKSDLKTAIRLFKTDNEFFTDKTGEYVIKTCEETYETINEILKAFWKININLREVARRELRKYLKDGE